MSHGANPFRCDGYLSQLAAAFLLCLSMTLWLSAGQPDEQPAASSPSADDDFQLIYRSTLAAAEKAIRLNETRDASYWLSQSPDQRRGWEWNYLHMLTDDSSAAINCGESRPTSMDLCSTTRQLAVAFVDGRVKLYTLPDLTELRTISGHTDAVYSVAFSPDGKRLATVSRDVTSRVWDAESGAEISQVKLVNPGVAAVAFSPDGLRVATCTWMLAQEEGKRTVKGIVWIGNAATGEVVHKAEVGVKPLDSITWSARGDRIAVGSWDGLVHYLAADGTEIRRLAVPETGIYNAVIAVDISPNGDWIACGSKDRSARIWNANSGELVASLQGHTGFVTEVRFTADGSQLITTSADGTVRVWQVDSGRQLAVLRGHLGNVAASALDHEPLQFYTAGQDLTLRRWDIGHRMTRPSEKRMEVEGTYTVSFNPAGDRVYVACYDGQVRVLDSRDRNVVDQWTAHEGSTCNTLSMNREGSRVLTCSWDKTAKLWNVADKTLLVTLRPEAPIYDCALSPDGKVAALTIGSDIQIWSTESGTQLGVCTGSNSDGLQEVRFSSDGTHVAAAGGSGNATVWNVDTRERLALLGDDRHKASTVCFSPDGRFIATSGVGKVHLWNMEDFELLREYSLGDRGADCLSFSPDGKRLAAAAQGITILDPDREGTLLRFQPNDDDVYSLEFSPDNRWLASCTASGSVACSSAGKTE